KPQEEQCIISEQQRTSHHHHLKAASNFLKKQPQSKQAESTSSQSSSSSSGRDSKPIAKSRRGSSKVGRQKVAVKIEPQTPTGATSTQVASASAAITASVDNSSSSSSCFRRFYLQRQPDGTTSLLFVPAANELNKGSKQHPNNNHIPTSIIPRSGQPSLLILGEPSSTTTTTSSTPVDPLAVPPLQQQQQPATLLMRIEKSSLVAPLVTLLDGPSSAPSTTTTATSAAHVRSITDLLQPSSSSTTFPAGLAGKEYYALPDFGNTASLLDSDLFFEDEDLAYVPYGNCNVDATEDGEDGGCYADLISTSLTSPSSSSVTSSPLLTSAPFNVSSSSSGAAHDDLGKQSGSNSNSSFLHSTTITTTATTSANNGAHEVYGGSYAAVEDMFEYGGGSCAMQTALMTCDNDPLISGNDISLKSSGGGGSGSTMANSGPFNRVHSSHSVSTTIPIPSSGAFFASTSASSSGNIGGSLPTYLIANDYAATMTSNGAFFESAVKEEFVAEGQDEDEDEDDSKTVVGWLTESANGIALFQSGQNNNNSAMIDLNGLQQQQQNSLISSTSSPTMLNGKQQQQQNFWAYDNGQNGLLTGEDNIVSSSSLVMSAAAAAAAEMDDASPEIETILLNGTNAVGGGGGRRLNSSPPKLSSSLPSGGFKSPNTLKMQNQNQQQQMLHLKKPFFVNHHQQQQNGHQAPLLTGLLQASTSANVNELLRTGNGPAHINLNGGLVSANGGAQLISGKSGRGGKAMFNGIGIGTGIGTTTPDEDDPGLLSDQGSDTGSLMDGMMEMMNVDGGVEGALDASDLIGDDEEDDDDESFYGDYEMSDLIGASTSDDQNNKWSLNMGRSRKGTEKRYFWQYNVQSKGPKGPRYATGANSASASAGGERGVSGDEEEDPHVFNEIADPVFAPDCQVEGVKHSGKARRGDGNDLTPNPKKLLMIGLELKKLSKVINELTPVTEVPAQSRNKSRKEKNKLASRACRLKKKAQHEANKIKLRGLYLEHTKANRQIAALRKIVEGCVKMARSGGQKGGSAPFYIAVDGASYQVAGPPASSVRSLESIVEEVAIRHQTVQEVAGRTADYVNGVLDNVTMGNFGGGIDNV
ncbi:hypothetical protein TYRP_006997, partial [Tyrophagus putrescentiae]